MRKTLLALTMIPLLLSGCVHVTSSGTYSRDGNPMRQLRSVFEEDQAVLTNDAVETLLTSAPAKPENARLAVMRLDTRIGESAWSSTTADAAERINDSFLAGLAKSNHIANAFLVPGMIQPSQISFPSLRATAARCRADLLLLYSVSREAETRARLFAPTEVRASCVVEALLFDTMTGTVQFTATSVQGYEAAQNDNDWSFGETIRRAELEAVGKALTEIAGDVVNYLDS